VGPTPWRTHRGGGDLMAEGILDQRGGADSNPHTTEREVGWPDVVVRWAGLTHVRIVRDATRVWSPVRTP
jgi:hypothetical protein